MNLNRSISFTTQWSNTLWISLVLAAILVVVLVFLQPFDTYSHQDEYKVLKLVGYSLCLIIPIMAMHSVELVVFKKNNSRWFLWNEIVYLIIAFAVISLFCYAYNVVIVNELPLHWSEFGNWLRTFGIPFAPLLLPFWIYLRYRFSKIVIQPLKKGSSNLPVSIVGKGNDELLKFNAKEFVMAVAQGNYIDIHLLKEGVTEKHTLRATISGLVGTIPGAQQVHRSYMIHLDQIEELKGNTRQGSAKLRDLKEEVPVSPKHFSALKEYLQTRP